MFSFKMTVAIVTARQFVVDHANEVFHRRGADEHSSVDEK
jgi:hypothetical protein